MYKKQAEKTTAINYALKRPEKQTEQTSTFHTNTVEGWLSEEKSNGIFY